MRGSLRLGTAFGIPIFLHWTFLLLLGFVAVSQFVASGSLTFALEGVAFVAVIFACVVLHELGHALAARRVGIGTSDVTLLPIGGVARLDRMPEDPKQELWVALAGPAVNLALAGMLAIWIFLTTSLSALGNGLAGGSFAGRLLSVNLALVAFNMLPAFPMDGGRVLRALLARRIGHLGATEVAAKVGRGMAVVFGIVGLLWMPMLVLIALFVWFGAGQEAELARRRAAHREWARPFGTDHLDSGPLEPEVIRPSDPAGRRRIYRVGPWLVYSDQRRPGE